MNSDRRFISELLSHTGETCSLFSNPRKREREIRICRALLRLFSVRFVEDELLEVPGEPVDVRVAGAGFQIFEILDEGRERSREIRERLAQYQRATRVEDVWERIAPGKSSSLAPRQIGTEELRIRLASALAAKEAHYGATACLGLDALVYVNLRAAVLRDEVLALPPNVGVQWRSVSILSNDRAVVASARESAPLFLQDRVGRPPEVWGRISGLWED